MLCYPVYGVYPQNCTTPSLSFASLSFLWESEMFVERRRASSKVTSGDDCISEHIVDCDACSTVCLFLIKSSGSDIKIIVKRKIKQSNTVIKESHQSFVRPLNFYLSRLSAKQLFMECHPDPQPHRETSPHPQLWTPTSASCSLGLAWWWSVC